MQDLSFSPTNELVLGIKGDISFHAVALKNFPNACKNRSRLITTEETVLNRPASFTAYAACSKHRSTNLVISAMNR